jgi:hypothetical protein
MEESIPKLGTVGNVMKKISFTKILLHQTELTACFRPKHASERNSELLSLPRNGSEQNSKCLLIILFRRTGLRVVFSSAEWFRTEFRAFASICSMVQNSEHFSPLRNSSQQNSENCLFRGTAGIPPDLWFPNQIVVGSHVATIAV